MKESLFQNCIPGNPPHKYIRMIAVFGMICALSLLSCSSCVYAYDAEKLYEKGLIRGDLSTWTQREDSFRENARVCVNGRSPLASMGCSYYATFFMLCKTGVMDPLKDTAWQFAQNCYDRGLSRSGTGYFDPRSIDEMTDGRVTYVEEGNFDNYYDGQRAIRSCSGTEAARNLLREYTEEKGYFCVVCCVGTVTNHRGEEYYSEGHYIFIDEVLDDDMVIGDSAFYGYRWSDNWGAHRSSIVKLYCYEAFDENGRKILPIECDSMYRIRRRVRNAYIPPSCCGKYFPRIGALIELSE